MADGSGSADLWWVCGVPLAYVLARPVYLAIGALKDEAGVLSAWQTGRCSMKRAWAWLDRAYLAIDQRLRGWPTLLVRTGLAFSRDGGAVVSRSIAYYALFSLFPLLLALASLSSTVIGSSEARQLLFDFAGSYLPASADLVQENIEQILRAQRTVGIVASLGLIWSASGVFSAIYRAVNRAWDNPRSGFFWGKLFGVAVVLVVGLLLLATTLLSTFLGVLQGWNLSLLGWEPFAGGGLTGLWSWLNKLGPAFVSAVTFVIIYRTIPRNGVTWGDVWLGGLAAGLIWEAARQLYTLYLANFARYSLVYGSVGAIIGFLLWSYLSAMILLLGAEFTAQYGLWRRAGKAIEPRPLSQWLKD
jgi:membrane protein